jgi:hypothetical protein
MPATYAARPRFTVNSEFLAAVRASGKPLWVLATSAGFCHYAAFSKLIHAREVPATPVTLGRLFRLADLIGFDRSSVFLAPPTSTARALESPEVAHV